MKKSNLNGIAALVTAFGMCLNAAAFSVCAVGDSITQGGGHFTAHRIALEDVFNANTWEVVWKGTRSNSSYGTLNPCEGYSGYNAESIAAKYEDNAASAVADVLLLHAGHNYNADSGTTEPACMPVADIVAAATNAHRRIIAAARAQNPNVVVLYAQVITSGGNKEAKYAYIPALNVGIAALAAELDTAASPVVVVNMAEGWNYATDCVSDCVHPNANGAEKMAAKWFAALKDLRDAGKIAVVSRAESAATLNVTADTTLSSDVVCDTVTVASNATLNLNGHKLSAKSLAGNGTVMSAMIDESPCAIGYDLLSYVESPADNNTDKCFIDTVFVPAATDRIETKVRLGGSVSKTQWLFGTYNSNKRMDVYLNSSKVFFMLGRKNNGNTAADASGTYEIILDGSRFKATVAKGGAPTPLAIESNDFTPDQCIYLFAANGTGATDQTRYADECRMYYFRVFDADGNLKVNMLPVRNASGTVGFYDTVRKTFYAPANGALTAGDVISYKALSYVTTPADNSGAFIDTLYWPSPSDRVETRVRLSNKTANQGLFSSRYDYKNNVFNCMMRSSGRISFDCYNYGGGNEYAYHTVDGVQTEYSTGKDYDLTMDGGSTVFSANGVASETYLYGGLVEVTTNFVLFATVDAKNGSVANFAKGCRMYCFRVTDTNGYERLNLVPAQLDDGGTVGFYDATHNAFLSPASGSLEAGVALPRDLTAPGGTCAMSPSSVYRGVVANLFNDNFLYRQSTDDRCLVNKNSTPLPLRIDYDFGAGNAKAVNVYRIHAATKARAPKAWVLYGSNNSSAYGATTGDDETEGWVALDVRDSQTDWTHNGTKNTSSESRIKVFANDTDYRFYRLKITDVASDPNYLELVQLEYFRVEGTDAPGVLNVDVARGVATTNVAVRLAGDMKLVKSGLGSFTAAKAGQDYLGGTDVKAGEFVVAAPLSTAMTVADGAALGFNFAAKDAVSMLTLSEGSAFPSTLGVSIYVGGDFALPGGGTQLTSGYDFSGTAIDFTKTGYARRITADASGNFWAYGPIGFVLIFE